MGESFLQRLEKEILVLSGAMGTTLHNEGANLVGQWIQEGAQIVSACCGSGPLYLKAIVEKVREFVPKK